MKKPPTGFVQSQFLPIYKTKNGPIDDYYTARGKQGPLFDGAEGAPLPISTSTREIIPTYILSRVATRPLKRPVLRFVKQQSAQVTVDNRSSLCSKAARNMQMRPAR